MVKIVKNPGKGRLNNLNDPVLHVLMSIHTDATQLQYGQQVQA